MSRNPANPANIAGAISKDADDLRYSRVRELVDLLVSGAWSDTRIAVLAETWGETKAYVNNCLLSARDVIRSAGKTDIEYVRGTVNQRLEQLYALAVSRTTPQNGKQIPWADIRGATAVLALQSKLAGAFEPQRISVEHSVTHKLEAIANLPPEQIQLIASGKLSAGEIRALTEGEPVKVCSDAEFEPLNKGNQ
jgi:hypothetical protein